MTDSDARWFAIRRLARHVFFCWPRLWRYDYQRDNADGLSLYRRTCLRCGLTHERLE